MQRHRSRVNWRFSTSSVPVVCQDSARLRRQGGTRSVRVRARCPHAAVCEAAMAAWGEHDGRRVCSTARARLAIATRTFANRCRASSSRSSSWGCSPRRTRTRTVSPVKGQHSCIGGREQDSKNKIQNNISREEDSEYLLYPENKIQNNIRATRRGHLDGSTRLVASMATSYKKMRSYWQNARSIRTNLPSFMHAHRGLRRRSC